MKSLLTTILFSVFLFFCSISSQANTPQNLIFSNLTLQDGLPALEVLSTYQQSNGFIWIATSRGAVRFDGYEYVHYYFEPNSAQHITNNFVTVIAEDNYSNIWLGTEDGLNRINADGSVDHFNKDDGLPSGWIINMTTDSAGDLWLSTGNGVTRLETETDTFNTIPLENWNTSADIQELPDGRIVATIERSLYWLNSPAATSPTLFEDSLLTLVGEEDLLTVLEVIDETTLAIGSEKSGLILVDLTSSEARRVTMQEGLSSNYITAILNTSENYFVLGHYNSGLSLVDKGSTHGHSIKHVEFDNLSLLSDDVRHLNLDANENLWVSTSQGVSKAKTFSSYQLFVPRADGSGLSDAEILKILSNNSNELYALSNRNLDEIDLSTGTIQQDVLAQFDIKLEENQSIWSMTKDQNLIWLVGSHGLYKLDLAERNATVFSNSPDNPSKIPTSELYTVLPEPSGGVWITGYYNVGLSLFNDPNGLVKQFMSEETDIYQSEGNYTQNKIIGSDGHIWMATTDGVFRVNRETGEYQHLRFGKGREYIRASDIQEDESGNYWVATEGAGLVKISLASDDETYEMQFFTTAHGLSSNELVSLAIDDSTIWVLSSQSLIKFDRTSEQAIDYPGLLQIPNLSFSIAGLLLKNNNLVASTNKGVVVIDKSRLKQSDYQAPIQISEVVTNTLDLTHPGDTFLGTVEGGDIEIKFASLDYSTIAKKSYLYRLVNYQEQWIPTNDNQIHYGNLPPGDYIFEVIGTNADGVWSTTPAQYSFRVARPLRDYVIGLLSLCFLAILLLFLYQRRKQMIDLHSQVRIDSLTGLANRIAFNEQLNNSMSIDNSIFALAVVDFDRFKDINDIHGHSVGDKFLIEVGKRLRHSIKGRDYIARLSGDEFVLIFYHFINEENLINLLNRIMAELNKIYLIDEVRIKGSVSIGVAIFPRDGSSREELFSHADTAMYHAKKLGKNQLYFFNEDLRKQLQRRISIKANLEEALRNGEFELHYQPKVHPSTMKIVGCEALIRWKHPEEGLIPPYQFIEEAEKNGFIVELGAWVIEQACVDYGKMKSVIDSLTSVSVNVSPIQLVKGDLMAVVEHALHKTDMVPECLELEITEYSLMDESTQTLELMDNLKRLGVNIALDDFGTGYSSLSYLTKYPIDTLKIDRSIISGASQGSSSLKVLHNIFLLAHSLEMQVVTEGVESLEQLKLVDNYTDDLIQGYLFCKPLTIEALFSFYKDYKQQHLS